MQLVTFKDQAALDLPTFLNDEEFADRLSIDGGEEVACVLEGAGDTEGGELGVIGRDVLMHVRTADFYAQPVVGLRLAVNEQQYDVIGINEEQGILELRLRWLDS